MYLRDCWYAVAWSDDVLSVPLERTICGGKLVLFRRSNGPRSSVIGGLPASVCLPGARQIAPLRPMTKIRRSVAAI